jgi:succinyl-diaminopimelate desuccinylase
MTARPVHDDTLALARQLLACRSVTPDDGGALDLVARRLTAAGFRCERLDRGGVGNLWARRGTSSPLVCLAGHVDVVPPGPIDQWTSDPFVPAERDGYLYGRGASDMKGPLAAMLTAVERVAASGAADHASLAVLLTSDEEGDALDGTNAVVDLLRARQITIDACILGEPTSADRLGDTVKNGRRGSLSGRLTVRGVQCHIAYPERGKNPIHLALPALAELAATRWDEGNDYFQPSSFQISNLMAGAGATNITPGTLDVAFNIRFSPESTEEGLKARVSEVLARHAIDDQVVWSVSGRPFLTPRGPLVAALSAAIAETTGVTPALSTGGGTSDGRFLAAIAREIVEFGPSNETIHKIDERVKVGDLAPLSAIYERALRSLVAPA